MRIYIGADHRGVELKTKIKKILEARKYQVVDLGTNDPDTSCDYPVVAYKVATAVAKDKTSKGILACMSGIGQSIAANKVKGAYAALCYTPLAATLSRQHNNSNILVLGVGFIKKTDISKIVNNWLDAEFEGGRHLRRFKQIQALEK